MRRTHHLAPAGSTHRALLLPWAAQEAEVKARFQAQMAASDMEGQGRNGLVAFAHGGAPVAEAAAGASG
jgi:hypothetical protein